MAVLVLLLIYYDLCHKFNYWKSKYVPFAKPFFIFGNFFNIITGKQHVSEILSDLYKKHKTEPYIGIYVFYIPTLLINSPELIKRILVKDFSKFINRKFASNEFTDPVFFHTLFGRKDETWKKLRGQVAPIFTTRNLELMLPLIKKCCQNLNFHLSGNVGIVDCKNFSKMYAVDVITSCLLGLDSHCLKNQNPEIFKQAIALSNPNSWKRNFSICSFFFFPQLVKLFRLTFVDKAASYFLLDIYKHSMHERKKRNVIRNDLIDLVKQLEEINDSN